MDVMFVFFRRAIFTLESSDDSPMMILKLFMTTSNKSKTMSCKEKKGLSFGKTMKIRT